MDMHAYVASFDRQESSVLLYRLHRFGNGGNALDVWRFGDGRKLGLR